jgi:type IV secretion system protein VirB4
MYDMRSLHQTMASPAELVLWGALVAGPEPIWGTNAQGHPIWTGWEEASPTVGLNQDGSYMATLAYRGADVTMMEQEERVVYLHRLNGVLKQLGTGWAVLTDEWHEEAKDYPNSTWTHPVPCFLDASRRALVASGQLYESMFYLTLTWKPESTRKQQWYEHLFMTETRLQVSDADNRAHFLHQATRWADALSGVLPAVRWLDPDETVTYLKNTVSWERTPLRMPAIPMYLHHQLTSADFLPGHTPQLGRLVVGSDPPRLEQYLRPITIKTWPDELGITVPAALQALPFPYRFTVRYIALDKQDGESVLRDLQEKWAQLIWEGWQIVGKLFPSDAQEQADSLDQPLLDLRDDRVSTGFLTPIVTVWGETPEVLEHREREVLKVLQQQGLLCMREDVNACQAWQGTLPGDNYHGVRQVPESSLALAFLLPHAAIWGGHRRDAHLGDHPLFVVSSDGTLFRYVMHQGEVGHFVIVGPTRRGKSAMLGFMAMQFLRYAGAQVFLFDKDYQLYTATMLAGGSHYDLGMSTAKGFHVLGRIGERREELIWAQTWLEGVFLAQGLPATAEEIPEITRALERVARQPARLRTLTTFAQCFQVRRLKPALVPFLRNEVYGFFDASADSFALDWWTTFEMGALLAQPAALPHAMSYIFHRMEDRFDGRPTFVGMDEASSTALAHPILSPKVKEYLKQKAKRNVSVGLCWQEMVDASDSPLWQAIQASCDTEIYVPNDAAMNADVWPHYRKVGLQPGQIQTLAMARPHCDYLYKTATATRLFQLRLSPVERLLCAASTQAEIARLRELVGQERTESLGAAWLRSWGYAAEADIFEAQYARRAA